MTVGQEIYSSSNHGSRGSTIMGIDRKNVPPPLNFKFPSLTLQQHHLHQQPPPPPQHNLQSPLNPISFPKSAPPQTTNNDLMQFHLQMMLQNESKTPGPTLKSQFSTPSSSNFHYSSSVSPVQSHGTPDSQGSLQQQQQQQQQNGTPEKNSANRYKTELCRPFEESGCCKYGDKCQFAHGIQELRDLSRHPKYKTEQCRTFHTIGFCPYGPRCHFIHNSEEKRAPPISPGPHNPGSHATLQNLPALLALLQQTNFNKLLNSFNKLQLGINNEQDFYQLLNGQQNILSPPSTPNMFSFHEYMVPVAAHALNQAARSTSNIHSYINFNIALKDQNLSNIIDAAQLTPLANSHISQHVYTPNNNTPPTMSPTGTPPLSNEGSPMSERNMDTSTYPISSLSGMMHRPPTHPHQQHLTHLYTPPSSTLDFQYYRQHDPHAKAIPGTDIITPGTDIITPGRIISEIPSSPTMVGASGKRLPIFNQISDKKHVVF